MLRVGEQGGLCVSREQGRVDGSREKEREERRRMEKRKEEKEKKGKRNGKEIGKKKMGGRERKRREGAVRASGDRGCGRPRVACGRGRWGTRSEGREEKGRAGFAAAGHDVSRWMGKR